MKDARRILSIWLPRFAAELRLRAMGGPPGDAPFAVVAEKSSALVLAGVDRAAEAAGLVPGMGLSDARAIQPDLVTRPAAPEREAAALAALARWAGRWSPLTATDGADGLILDVTGCAHLFGGEASLAATAEASLADLGFAARLAIADTRGAAWALARFAAAEGPAIAAPGKVGERLHGLPIEGLRLTPETLTLLKRLGLRRIGELRRLPRTSLQRRF
ncbi:MAG: DNA polymerase Y family protein, partial [Pseudomonadota bacterium]